MKHKEDSACGSGVRLRQGGPTHPAEVGALRSILEVLIFHCGRFPDDSERSVPELCRVRFVYVEMSLMHCTGLI
jgi:hypothetical protein